MGSRRELPMSVSNPFIEPRSYDLAASWCGAPCRTQRRAPSDPLYSFDHMGPADFAPGRVSTCVLTRTLVLPPSPFVRRRDHSSRQPGFSRDIRPGDVNWMTAGRGIVHSGAHTGRRNERAAGHRLHGLQICGTAAVGGRGGAGVPPPPGSDPAGLGGGTGCAAPAARGRALWWSAVARAYLSPMFYLALEAATAAEFALDASHAERAVYVASGGGMWDGQLPRAGQMLVPLAGRRCGGPSAQARFALFGGALPRRPALAVVELFVSSSRERIEQAKADWRQSASAGCRETEFIPLP